MGDGLGTGLGEGDGEGEGLGLGAGDGEGDGLGDGHGLTPQTRTSSAVTRAARASNSARVTPLGAAAASEIIAAARSKPAPTEATTLPISAPRLGVRGDTTHGPKVHPAVVSEPGRIDDLEVSAPDDT